MPPTSSPTVLSDRHDGVLTITLNQPDRLNALSDDMLLALADVVRTAERDSATRALVLTGAGRAFSSGADLSELDLTPPGPPLGDRLLSRIHPTIVRLRTMEKPVLAAVNGVAAGAGLSLALACDIRYAGESARFLAAFVRIGLVPDAGSMYSLPRLVGTAKALEMCLTGDAVVAAESLALGLVNRVLPDDDLLPGTQALAARLAAGPAVAIGLIKRGLSASHELPLDRVLELEAGYQTIAARSADFREGVTAFREKRPPRFGQPGVDERLQ